MVSRLLLALAAATHCSATPTFNIANDEFVQDGKVAHLRAGCIHYSVRRWLRAPLLRSRLTGRRARPAAAATNRRRTRLRSACRRSTGRTASSA